MRICYIVDFSTRTVLLRTDGDSDYFTQNWRILKSSSSAAIKFGVKLLLSVKNKKKSDFILQTARTQTRGDVCRARKC